MRTMKHFFSLILFIFAITFAACSGCKSDKPKGPQPTTFEQKLQQKDTTVVKKLIADFYDHLRVGEYADAVQMLYSRPQGPGSPIKELDNQEIDRYLSFFRMLPFEDYSIEYMKFFSNDQNEVKCKVILQKGKNGAPDATTYMFFTPVMYNGEWKLILTNSRNAEHPVSTDEQRDSLKAVYRNSRAGTKK